MNWEIWRCVGDECEDFVMVVVYWEGGWVEIERGCRLRGWKGIERERLE